IFPPQPLLQRFPLLYGHPLNPPFGIFLKNVKYFCLLIDKIRSLRYDVVVSQRILLPATADGGSYFPTLFLSIKISGGHSSFSLLFFTNPFYQPVFSV
ncbi:MAG: hypothetical protein LUG57_05075, partial [Oscillospiraceae bacterium]|nr:hypothetical protein [Oscillospiraceae bacterium]